MSKASDRKTEALLAEAFQKLPLRLTCPKCGKSKAKKRFGIRVVARNSAGIPTRIIRQSYCAQCRR